MYQFIQASKRDISLQSVSLASKTKFFPLYILGFACSFALLVMHSYEILPTEKISQVSVQFVLFLHVFMVIAAFKAFKNTVRERKMLFWLIPVNVGLFLNDLSYYFMIYFSKNYSFNFSLVNYNINMTLLSVWNISILIFFMYLIKDVFTKKFIKLFLILLWVNLAILYLFFDSVPSFFNDCSWQNISQIISSFVELIIYNLSILCLICSSKKELSFLATGLIIAISGDFILSFSFLAQTNSIAFYGEFLWFLGNLCMFLGMLHLIDQKHDGHWLRSVNSLKSNVAFCAFGISIVKVLLFFILAYLFSPINKVVFLGLPSFLMITSVLIVILSLFTAKYFEKPFKKIVNNIESLMLNNDKSKLNSHFVIEEFIFLQEFILKMFDLKEDKEAARKAFISLTAQVAHDIRSPLTALNTCLNTFTQIPEKQRILMRNVSERINDIANNLLHQYEEQGDPAITPLLLQTWLVAPLLESIVSEKRLQFEGRTIELVENIASGGFSAFAVFDHSRMKRLLSNLLNNASESFSEQGGKIVLKLEASEETIFLKIKDNGCGIVPELLNQVLLGKSNKANGFGLGLPNAKRNIEAFNGTLHLHSEVNEGTTVELRLPRAHPPQWFVPEIVVSNQIVIAILDDDLSVHDAWEQRLFLVSENLTVHYFKTISDFSDWYDVQTTPVQIFSDYELLGESETGLSVLENRRMEDEAILVTSHYENPDVIIHCQKISVRLLPKNLLTHISINLSAPVFIERNDYEEVL